MQMKIKGGSPKPLQEDRNERPSTLAAGGFKMRVEQLQLLCLRQLL
jgi:hypothetical protein